MKKYLKFLVFISILSCNKDYNDFNNNLLNYLSENNLNISIENSSNNCNLLQRINRVDMLLGRYQRPIM